MARLKKYFFINIIIFLFILTTVFGVGFFMIDKAGETLAAEDSSDEDATPPVISNIEISSITATSSIITWQTDEQSDSLVNYGLDRRYGVVRDPRPDKIAHTIVLDDLAPDTLYYYRITSTDASGNQGISSDFSFTTKTPVEQPHEGWSVEVPVQGQGGVSQEGVDQILQTIQNVSSEQTLQKIEQAVQQQAQEVVKPPTIILDLANVEVGVDYAVIPWKTDKLSNSIVALAKESDYNEGADDPYVWKEGEPDELVEDHVVRVNGLAPATVYHFQVSSQSEIGLTGKSDDRTFKTKSILPEIANIQIVKIQEDSATIDWTTNVPCTSIVNYTNLNTNDTKLEGNASNYLTIHSVKLTNLIFDTYYSVIITVESEAGEKAESDALTFITTKDEYPPAIAKVNTESTLYPGADNKIQTIVSWETDEPGKCQLFYHQGLVVVDEPDTLPAEEDYGVKHVHVVTNFLPSTVYKFWIVCADEADNEGKSADYTMLTPTKEMSIIDIILKNFESTFGWVKNIGGGGG